MSLQRHIATLVGALALAACSGGSAPSPITADCTVVGDSAGCAGGQTCVSGHCLTTCARSADCGAQEDCVAKACATYTQPCAAPADCRPGWRCAPAIGACTKILPKGLVCAEAADCASGFCVGGVCCDTACQGECWSCSVGAVLGDGDDGQCTVRLGGKCAGTADGPCSAEGCVCDAQGSCLRASGTGCSGAAQCASGACRGGYCCTGACGAACMSCDPGATGAAAGVCAPVLAGLDPSDECLGALACTGAGACFGKALGAPCAFGDECVSGWCADSVCCDSACVGECVACDGAQTLSTVAGNCGVVGPGADPANECVDRTACDGLGHCWNSPTGAACAATYECAGGRCETNVCSIDILSSTNQPPNATQAAMSLGIEFTRPIEVCNTAGVIDFYDLAIVVDRAPLGVVATKPTNAYANAVFGISPDRRHLYLTPVVNAVDIGDDARVTFKNIRVQLAGTTECVALSSLKYRDTSTPVVLAFWITHI